MIRPNQYRGFRNIWERIFISEWTKEIFFAVLYLGEIIEFFIHGSHVRVTVWWAESRFRPQRIQILGIFESSSRRDPITQHKTWRII